jgi:hypothetical protein
MNPEGYNSLNVSLKTYKHSFAFFPQILHFANPYSYQDKILKD